MLAYEIILRIQRGPVPSEPISPLFNYNYVDIYKKFFKKVILPDGNIIYKSQRNPNLYIEFPAYKRKDTKRIFVVGGSVALLTFKDNSYIKNMLQELFPEIRFEIINCGMAGYDSYRERILVEEVLHYEPDLIIIMTGNNEFYSPVRLNIAIYKLNHLLRRSWAFREFHDKMFNANIEKPIPEKYRLINFEKNLRIIARKTKKKNVSMLMCTLPVNFKDCSPKGTPGWRDKQFLLAWLDLSDKKIEKAINGFEQFILANPTDPFGYYFLAKSYEFVKNYSNAQELYLKALSLDSNSKDRCTPERNQIIRSICTHEKLMLVDLEKAFINIASHGLLGKEIFMDNCHWWNEYNIIAKVEIIKAIIKSNLLNLESKYNFLYNPSTDPIFKNKVSNIEEETLELVECAFGELCNYNVSFFSERTITFLEATYDIDHKFFDDVITLKERIYNDIKDSFFGKEIILKFDTYWPAFLCHIGECFRRLGLFDKSIKYFNQAIELDSNLKQAYLSRGFSYYKIGLIEQAYNDFEKLKDDTIYNQLIQLYIRYAGNSA